VAKPVKHRGKWRIRWVDEHEKRQSAVFDDYKRAQTELSRRQVEVEEIKRGIRNAAPPEKTGDEIFDYWIEKRACRKRSQRGDESIIRRHLGPAFGNPTGPRCVGDATNGAGLCGCLSDADCATGKCKLVGLRGGAFPGGYCE
jgi:hypothetical protein